MLICPKPKQTNNQYYITPSEFFIPALADGLSLESPQVSRTILSILADLSYTVVWVISVRPPISNFSNFLTIPWRSFRAHRLQLVSTSLPCSLAFLVLWQGLCTFYFCFLWVSLCGPPGRQSSLYGRFSLFFFFFFFCCGWGLILIWSGLLAGIRSVYITKYYYSFI